MCIRDRYYSENLAQNVKRGNYDSALELKTLGKTCLGLKTGPDGRYMIDQAEAVIVRRIFEEYAEGERAKDIYERLNSEGYRTSRGGKFNKNSLRRILSNKKYIGVYEYEDKMCIRDRSYTRRMESCPFISSKPIISSFGIFVLL